MSDKDSRKEYAVMIGGLEHTLLLDAEAAERMDAVLVKASTPANKAAAPTNKKA